MNLSNVDIEALRRLVRVLACTHCFALMDVVREERGETEAVVLPYRPGSSLLQVCSRVQTIFLVMSTMYQRGGQGACLRCKE